MPGILPAMRTNFGSAAFVMLPGGQTAAGVPADPYSACHLLAYLNFLYLRI